VRGYKAAGGARVVESVWEDERIYGCGGGVGGAYSDDALAAAVTRAGRVAADDPGPCLALGIAVAGGLKTGGGDANWWSASANQQLMP